MSGFELKDEDVVHMVVDENFAGTTTSRVEEIKQAFLSNVLGHYACWMTKGVPCRALLESGGGWQKGRIRLHFEFIPDELTEVKLLTPADPDSPLADLDI